MFYIIDKNKASSIIAGCCHGHKDPVCPIDPETGLPNCENVEKHCKTKHKSSSH